MKSFFARAAKVLCVLVVLFLCVAAAAVSWIFYRAMPEYAGTAALPGLEAPVNVVRDQYGVPHIFASNMNDAARALGYVHAGERLFQMEMQRRAGQGRLSEIIGADMLGVDKYIRTLNLYALAQSSYESFSPEAQKYLSAYAEGVNAWLDTHRNALPPEFLVLGVAPEPWKPADSVVWGKLMTLELSKNYRLEMLRAELQKKLSPAQMTALFPPLPADSPVTTDPQPGLSNAPPKTGASFNETPDIPGDTLGRFLGLDHAASNEWVIAGDRTATGKPILANDPHLGLEAPVLWYLARIVTPGLTVKGATVPGLPVILLGQNDHIAWGFTTTGSDVQDLFIETVDPKNSDNYLTPDGSKPFDTRTEVIHVKDAPDVALHVRATRHGPIMSDIDPKMAALAGDNHVMALAFTALGARDTTSEALIRLNRAQNHDEFLAALRLYQGPTQNVVYADTAGHIGFISPGLLPVRKHGDGLVPVDGASGDYDWTGFLPFDQLPQIEDPKAGFIFNANNAIVGPGYPHFIGSDWEEPYRARRLQQFFDTVTTHTLDSSAHMQADHLSLAARQLLPYLLAQKPANQRTAEALAILHGWDGTMDKNRPEPLIFDAWLYEMQKLMLAGESGSPLKEKGPYSATSIDWILSHDFLGSNQGWCGKSGCGPDIVDALDQAVYMLMQRDGMDMKAWRWGNEHVTVLHHKFYSHVPVLKEISKLDVASSGDFYTLDRGGSGEINPDHPFERTHGGGFRGIYDLADPDQSRFMITTGESGHIFSRHYGDLVKLWNNVQAFTLSGSRKELKAKGLPELVLTPMP